MGEERGRGILSQSAVLTSATGAAAVLSAAYAALAGRWLGPAAFGDLSAALALAYLFFLLLDPVEAGFCKFAAAFHGEGALGKQAALLSGGLRLLVLLAAAGVVVWLPLGLAVRGWLRLEAPGAVAGWTAFAAAAVLICAPRGVLRGDHRFLAYGLNHVAESGARLACGGAALALGAGAGGALAGYAAGTTAALAFGLWQVRDLRRHPPEPIDTRRISSFSLPLLCVYGYFVFAMNIDMLVVKRSLTETEAGLYGAASTLARFLYLGVTPILFVLFSHASSLHARGLSPRRLALVVALALAAGLPAGLAAIWFGSEHVLRTVFGEEYVGGGPTLRILWLNTSLLAFQYLGAFVLLGVDRTRGAWAFLLPCVLQAVLLWHFHESAVQVALCGLAAVVAGAGVLAGLLLLPAPAPARP